MENLFFLLIVVIIIVSNVLSIRKRMRDQQAGAPEQKKQKPQTGWRKSVENLLEQLKEEFEPLSDQAADRERAPQEMRKTSYEEKDISRQPSERSPHWQERKRKIERSYSMEGKESLLDRQSRDKDIIKRQAAVTRKDSEAIRGDAAVSERKPRVAGTPAEGFSSRPGYTYSVAQLQRAVIWSEILGHPVALRKGRRETWL